LTKKLIREEIGYQQQSKWAGTEEMKDELAVRDRQQVATESDTLDLSSESIAVSARPEPELFTSREVTIRYRGPALKVDPLSEPKSAAQFISKIIRDDAKEHFIAVYLDARHRPLGHSVVSIGTASSSLVHPREVFQPGVHLGAAAIVVAHNHPSGDVRPSSEDGAVTKRLREAGDLLGIKLVDSLIVSRHGDCYSYCQENPQDFGLPRSVFAD
jgi:DNA repair protein RadC